MTNKDLIDFTKKILGRYNATPDEWDAFEAACEPPDSKLWDGISELEACVRQTCN